MRRWTLAALYAVALAVKGVHDSPLAEMAEWLTKRVSSAELALTGDLAGQLGHHEGAALVDGEHRRTDADLHRRRPLTNLVERPACHRGRTHVSG